MAGTLGRRAWLVLFVIGLLELVFGLTLLTLGAAGVPNVLEEIEDRTWEQIAAQSGEAGLIDYLARGWGQTNIQYGIATMALALVPLRRREAWSWYVLWFVPITLLVTVMRNVALGVTSVVIIDLVESVIAAAALLLAYPVMSRHAHAPGP